MESWSMAWLVLAFVGFGVWTVYCYRKIRSVFLLNEFQEITLADRVVLSRDSCRLRFALESPTQKLGLPVGQHIRFYVKNYEGKEAGKWNGKTDNTVDDEIFRAYTPISGNDLLGFVDFVIKFYRPNEKPQFPDGGKVSQVLETLKVGDKLKIRGPTGRIEYKGNGQFLVGGAPVVGKHINMIAGGTGITPMIQVAKAMVDYDDEQTSAKMIYGSQREDDILCRDLLDSMASEGERLSVWYTLDTLEGASPGWKYSHGYVDADMIKDHLHPPGSDTVTLLCGPPPLTASATELLVAAGHDRKRVIRF